MLSVGPYGRIRNGPSLILQHFIPAIKRFAVKYIAKLKATISLLLRRNIAFLFLYKVQQVVGRKVCVLRFATVTVYTSYGPSTCFESETSSCTSRYVINTTTASHRLPVKLTECRQK